MRSATIMTALCAGLALAGPIVKKALVTHYVTVYDYIYVTNGIAPTTHHVSTHQHHRHHRPKPPCTSSPSDSAATAPAPAPAPAVVSKPVSIAEAPASPTLSSTTSLADEVNPEPTTSETDEVNPEPTTSEAVVVAATTTTPVTAATSAAELVDPGSAGSFEDIVLYHHNIHRANNSVDPLGNDERMAGYARTVAASCKYAHDLSPGGGGYGQNIAVYGTTANPIAIGDKTSIARAITNMWYNGEVDLFPQADYGKADPDMTNFEEWGHYSQVVWKSTTGVGCAAQFCDKGTIFDDMGSWFSVCNYFPAGNVGGAYGTNVFPPLGHPAIVA